MEYQKIENVLNNGVAIDASNQPSNLEQKIWLK